MEKRKRVKASLITDEDVLADLRSVASKLGRDTISMTAYTKSSEKFYGEFIRKKFGSWNRAIVLAGLKCSTHYIIVNSDQLLSDLKRVAQEMNRDDIKGNAYYKHSGKHASGTVISRFGSWNKAMKLAGLKPAKNAKIVSSEDLLANLKRVAEKLNQDNFTANKYHFNSAKYARETVITRFGSWDNAMKAAGLQPAKKLHVATKQELLDDLKRVGAITNKGSITGNEYRENSGKYSIHSFLNRFGKWNIAVEEAGFKPKKRGKNKKPKKQ